jgi:hypothetical protein
LYKKVGISLASANLSSNGVNTCTNINFAGIGLRQFGAVIYNSYCKDTIIAKEVYLKENRPSPSSKSTQASTEPFLFLLWAQLQSV